MRESENSVFQQLDSDSIKRVKLYCKISHGNNANVNAVTVLLWNIRIRSCWLKNIVWRQKKIRFCLCRDFWIKTETIHLKKEEILEKEQREKHRHFHRPYENNFLRRLLKIYFENIRRCKIYNGTVETPSNWDKCCKIV